MGKVLMSKNEMKVKWGVQRATGPGKVFMGCSNINYHVIFKPVKQLSTETISVAL